MQNKDTDKIIAELKSIAEQNKTKENILGSHINDIEYLLNTHQFNARGFAQLLLLLTRLHGTWEEIKNSNLFELLIKKFISLLINRLNPYDFSQIMLSFATLGFKWIDFKNAKLDNPALDIDTFIFYSFFNTAHQFTPLETIDFLFATAKMGLSWQEIKEQDLDLKVFEILRKNRNAFRGENLHEAKILWALAQFQLRWEELQKENLDNLAYSIPLALLQTKGDNVTACRQIYQAQLWFGFDLDPHVQSILKETLDKSPKPESSNSHIIAARIIKKLTHEEFEMEARYGYGIFVDICFNKLNVVIEVDGPTHLREKHLDAFKETLLKERFSAKTYRLLCEETEVAYLTYFLKTIGIKLVDTSSLREYLQKSCHHFSNDPILLNDFLKEIGVISHDKDEKQPIPDVIPLRKTEIKSPWNRDRDRAKPNTSAGANSKETKVETTPSSKTSAPIAKPLNKSEIKSVWGKPKEPKLKSVWQNPCNQVTRKAQDNDPNFPSLNRIK